MAQSAHLITVETLRLLGRPIGKVDEAQLEAYIEEAEQLLVKPSIGEALYLKLLYSDYDSGDDRYSVLLNGGFYDDNANVYCKCKSENEDDTEENEYHVGSHHIMGLRPAISYYVYAQNIMTGDFQSTRYGMVVKDNDYSTHLSSKERSDAYNNALEVANTYLNESVVYAKKVGLINARTRVRGAGSVRIKRIG